MVLSLAVAGCPPVPPVETTKPVSAPVPTVSAAPATSASAAPGAVDAGAAP
jgi:hypothetical protein